jgi:flagellin-like hook-associated protein FlgL
MKFTMQQYVYNASLQMGSRLLQNSLFDYMR